jgi:hypothetical protein
VRVNNSSASRTDSAEKKGWRRSKSCGVIPAAP